MQSRPNLNKLRGFMAIVLVLRIGTSLFERSKNPRGKLNERGNTRHFVMSHELCRWRHMTSFVCSVSTCQTSVWRHLYAAAGPVTLELSGSGTKWIRDSRPWTRVKFGQLEIHDWWSHQGPKDLHWDRDCMRRWQCRHNGVFSSQPCPLQQVQRLKWFIFFSRDPWAPSPWTPPRNAISSYSCEL